MSTSGYSTSNFRLVPIMLLMLIFCGLVSNGQTAKSWQTSPHGLRYQIFPGHTKAQKPGKGDRLSVDLVYKSDKDSVIFDSRKSFKTFDIPLLESEYPGDIYEGFDMLNVNDSAVFLILADSFFIRTAAASIPDFIKPGSYLSFEVKLLSFQKEEEFQRKKKEETDRLMAQESIEIQKYIKEKKIKVKPTESGLYYIETKEGKGPSVSVGQKLKVKYKGMFLDGTPFDSSEDHGSPFTFNLGAGDVIPGWEEGMAKMKVGGEAIFIIPSSLAYGSKGVAQIKPYTPLLFEVVLLSVE